MIQTHLVQVHDLNYVMMLRTGSRLYRDKLWVGFWNIFKHSDSAVSWKQRSLTCHPEVRSFYLCPLVAFNNGISKY